MPVMVAPPAEVEGDDEEDGEAEGDSEVGDELQLIANVVARSATADVRAARSRLNMELPPVADEQVVYRLRTCRRRAALAAGSIRLTKRAYEILMRVDGNRRSDVSNRRHGKWNQSCTNAGPMTSTIQKQFENLFHASARHVAGKAGRMRTLHRALRQRPSFGEAVLKASRLLVVSIVVAWAAPAFAQTSLQPTLEQLRPEYPTPMSPAQLAELLDRVAWLHRSEGWGLLRKDTGNRCPLSNGVPVSCDFLFHLPSRQGFDVLIRSDTDAVPAWQGPVDLSTAVSRFIAPIPPPQGIGPEPASPRTPTVTTVRDYDGDGRADVTVYRQTTGEWFIRRSSDGGLTYQPWGAPSLGDVPVPADYDGDGIADIAVYRRSTGQWFGLLSVAGPELQVAWGAALGDDLPVPGDYDGDGKADLAVYRPSTGQWFILLSSTRSLVQQSWGAAQIDIPVPGDYDGDHKIDLAVYRTTTGEWFIRRSSDGGLTYQPWGAPSLGDIPIPADYDGDGKADITVFRQSSGDWFVRRSSNGSLQQVAWGAPSLGDTPVPGDYDGDGKADIAVYRASTGGWFIRRSSDGGLTNISWGSPPLLDVVR